jgi:hypothetical protein
MPYHSCKLLFLYLHPSQSSWGFVISGAFVETLDDIDEALLHLSLMPASDRGAGWRAYLDAVLEQRAGLEKNNGDYIQG